MCPLGSEAGATSPLGSKLLRVLAALTVVGPVDKNPTAVANLQCQSELNPQPPAPETPWPPPCRHHAGQLQLKCTVVRATDCTHLKAVQTAVAFEPHMPGGLQH